MTGVQASLSTDFSARHTRRPARPAPAFSSCVCATPARHRCLPAFHRSRHRCLCILVPTPAPAFSFRRPYSNQLIRACILIKSPQNCACLVNTLSPPQVIGVCIVNTLSRNTHTHTHITLSIDTPSIHTPTTLFLSKHCPGKAPMMPHPQPPISHYPYAYTTPPCLNRSQSPPAMPQPVSVSLPNVSHPLSPTCK